MTESNNPGKPAIEPNNPLESSKSAWGISISGGEDDIDIFLSDRASFNLKLGGWFFGILFLFTMFLSLYICFGNPEKNSFTGILQASERFDLRFPVSSPKDRVMVEEIMINEGSLVASGQSLVRFDSGTGSSSFLRAPINGVVESVIVSPSQGTDAGSIACRLAGTRSFSFLVKAPETSLDKLSLKKTCRLQFNAYPELDFSGIIETIGEKGEYNETLGYSLFPVSVKVDNPNQLLRIGMSGSATLN